MVKLGNFFFRTRNYLFPFFYLILFLPFPRLSKSYGVVFLIGASIALLGQMVRMLTIGLVYIVRGGKNRRIYAEGLVTDGIFSHCRNPMYVGNVLLVIGMSVLSNSIFAMVVMIPLFILIYQAIIRAEETFLRDKFGPGFDAYCKRVNRWVPKLNGIGKTFSENDFNFKKVLFKEYNASFLWMMGATLLFVYNAYWVGMDISMQGLGPIFLVIITLLLLFYFTVRFFKKREQRKKRKLLEENVT